LPLAKTIIDAQLHEPALSLEWADADTETRWAALLEAQLAFMAAVGVDKAVLFPIEHEWGVWACERVPDRFAFVPMITPPGVPGGIKVDDPRFGELVAHWRATPACVALRMMHTLPGRLFAGAGADAAPWVSDVDMYEPLFAACLEHHFPLFMSTAGALDGPAEVVRRHPELVVIVDHLGMRQNPTFGLDDPPLRDLPRLLALAELPNVHVKVSGVPTLSSTGYPFEDLWDGLDQVLRAFGAERLMWGSDISRVMGRAGSVQLAPPGLDYARHTYAEALFYLKHTDRLTTRQKELLLGGTAAAALGWGA
jgi:predicted TIM-barrel fold metal-dependent hydrolase